MYQNLLIRVLSGLNCVICLATVLFFTSCQKSAEGSPDEPPGIDSTFAPHLRDSTKLIKSILYSTQNNAPQIDSLLETYNYDSTNRTITLSWIGYGNYIYRTNTSAVFKYNQRGYLTNVDYHYPPGFPPDAVISKIVMTYDHADILSSIKMTTLENNSSSIQLVKSDTASGYTLSWTDLTYGLKRAKFNAAGKCIVSRFEYLGDSLPGVGKFILDDSMTYDVAGNVEKVIQIYRNYETNTTMERLLFHNISRETIGDELYNQRQLLLRGFANMPDQASSFYTQFFGCLSFDSDINTNLQYHKYPIQTASAYNYYVVNTYRDYTADNEFDSEDRLSVFRGFRNDEDMTTTTYKITYYR